MKSHRALGAKRKRRRNRDVSTCCLLFKLTRLVTLAIMLTICPFLLNLSFRRSQQLKWIALLILTALSLGCLTFASSPRNADPL